MARRKLTVLGALAWTSDLLDPIINAEIDENYDGTIARDYIIQECRDMGLIWQDVNTLKYLIIVWAQSNTHRWQKMFTTEYLEYNPIENYDRMEEWHDNGTSEQQTSVAAYDSKDFEPQAKADGNGDSWHTGRTHGNIGVTTSQQMIQAERQILEFNFYQWLANEFKKRFCVALY